MALKPTQPKSGHLRGESKNPTNRKGKDPTQLRGQGVTGGYDHIDAPPRRRAVPLTMTPLQEPPAVSFNATPTR
jgi:hypothetical protein